MATDERATFGALLRRYRLDAGLSQEALAERARLSADGIAALERGRRTNPRPETVALLAAALALGPAERAAMLAAAAPPAARAAVRRHVALPATPTILIGRERESAAVLGLLRRTENPVRLLTLTGSGGVGKTRLALAVAAELRDDFADGVVFVDLAPLHELALVAPTIAQALGNGEVSGQRAADLLRAYLQRRRMLLVLDNFEQVVGAAPLLAELIAACPHLALLVTSRMALRVRGEQQFAVPPLETPTLTPVPAPSALAQCASVRLFVERARAIRPDFQLAAGNAAAVAAICRQLDGLPLAIELAAARVHVLPPPALLARLAPVVSTEWGAGVLAGGARDLPARQQTLRATIDWSYRLLAEDERALFRRLAVFDGGVTIEAAEQICAPRRRMDVLGCLAALVDKSLLRRDDGAADEPRLAFLETIRTYALEQLQASGEEDAVRRAHAHYYLALAEAAAPRLRGGEQAAWLDRVEREHLNMRAALAWAWQERQGEIGLRLAVALWQFWRIRGYLSEGRAWLQRLLAMDDSHAAPAAVRAVALTAAAWLAHPQHDYAAAIAWLEESLALRRRLGLPDGLTDLLIHRALQARAAGEYGQAVRLLEESLARHRALGNREGIGARGLGLSLSRLGTVVREQGDLARATALFQECLALHRQLDDREGCAVALLGLGDSARDRGDMEEVGVYCQESHAIFEQLGDKWGIGFSLNNLALAAYGQGDLERARGLAEQSIGVFRDQGSDPAVAEALITLGRIAAADGDAAGALAALTESLTITRLRGPRYIVPSALEVLAALAVSQQRASLAARLLGAAAGLRATIGASLPIAFRPAREQTLAATRAALDGAAFAAAWAAGKALTLEQAIDEALGNPLFQC